MAAGAARGEGDVSVKRSTPSSGNVFADLGLPDAEEALTKADLAREIVRVIRRREWTQAEAARVLGIDQPKVSALMRGRLDGFSTDRLLRFLNELDQEVEIAVRPKEATVEHAQVRVSIKDDRHQAAIASGPMTADTAAKAIAAQNTAIIDTVTRGFGAKAIYDSVWRAFGPLSVAEAARSALSSGLASPAFKAMAASISAAALAGETLQTFGTSSAMRELQEAAASIAKLEAALAMRELQAAANELTALNSDFAPTAGRMAEEIRSLGTAMADIFASGAAAIAFRTADGVVEVEPTGKVVRIQQKDESEEEIVEIAVSAGMRLQRLARPRQFRLIVGAVWIELDEDTDLLAAGD